MHLGDQTLLAKWVILAKLSNLTEPKSPHVESGGNDTYLIGRLGGLHGIADIYKCLACNG